MWQITFDAQIKSVLFINLGKFSIFSELKKSSKVFIFLFFDILATFFDGSNPSMLLGFSAKLLKKVPSLEPISIIFEFVFK